MIKNFDFILPVRSDHFKDGLGEIYIQKMTDLPPHIKMYAKMTIPPKSSIGAHYHVDDEEMMYCLEGMGTIYMNGENHEFQKGDVHYLKRGQYHSITNTSQKDLTILAMILQ